MNASQSSEVVSEIDVSAYRDVFTHLLSFTEPRREHNEYCNVLGARGSVMVKALFYKPDVAGSRPDEVNGIF
jgi:hypothetical protein